MPLAAARNRAAAEATARGADQLIFLDVDCIPGPRTVATYAQALTDPGSTLAPPAVLGGDVAWIPRGGLRLYGQFLLDELVVSRIGEGWWGNKWGWIFGTDVADLPVRDLTLKLEFARLRPFLYAHRSAATSYVHYGDVLGHPAGPNAWDALLQVRYRPTPRIDGALTVARTVRGRNSDSLNVGSDPREPYTSRFADTGIRLLDGVRQTEWLIEAWAGYELLPRLHLDLALRAESTRDEERGVDRYLVPMVQVRWGMAMRSERY